MTDCQTWISRTVKEERVFTLEQMEATNRWCLDRALYWHLLFGQDQNINRYLIFHWTENSTFDLTDSNEYCQCGICQQEDDRSIVRGRSVDRIPRFPIRMCIHGSISCTSEWTQTFIRLMRRSTRVSAATGRSLPLFPSINGCHFREKNSSNDAHSRGSLLRIWNRLKIYLRVLVQALIIITLIDVM